jgi:hypothetical protein
VEIAAFVERTFISFQIPLDGEHGLSLATAEVPKEPFRYSFASATTSRTSDPGVLLIWHCGIYSESRRRTKRFYDRE